MATMLAAGKLKRASAPGTQMLDRSTAHKMWKKPADTFSGGDGGRGSGGSPSAVAVPDFEMQAMLAWQQQLDAAGFQPLVDNIWEAMMQESPDPELDQKQGAVFATYHQLHRRIVRTLGIDEPATEAGSVAMAREDFEIDVERGGAGRGRQSHLVFSTSSCPPALILHSCKRKW